MSQLSINPGNESEWRELVSGYPDDCGGIIMEIRNAIDDRERKKRHLAQLAEQAGRIDQSSDKWKRVMQEAEQLETDLGL